MDEGKVKIHFLSTDKEEYKIPSCRMECFLVERTKDPEWESFGFFPVSTPDQMWKRENNFASERCFLSCGNKGDD